ncbi:hypothetical protein SCAR479_01805 [Seiridium cardinale]|uniref:Uncharacterized protein n=1 Tax=Seiridium cardinale TaxID=138064 RepID=A0ABR2Y6W8_9PEZI
MMSLKEIVPGVFVVSVPAHDAGAFQGFFAAFKKTFMDDEDNASCSSIATPSLIARLWSSSPGLPTAPLLARPWMPPAEGISSTGDEVGSKAQRQQVHSRQESEESKSLEACSPALPLHPDLGRLQYPPARLPKPAYPDPPKERTIRENAYFQPRPVSIASDDGPDVASYPVPEQELAHPHTHSLSHSAPKVGSRHYIGSGMSTPREKQPARDQRSGVIGFCNCCEQGAASRAQQRL